MTSTNQNKIYLVGISLLIIVILIACQYSTTSNFQPSELAQKILDGQDIKKRTNEVNTKYEQITDDVEIQIDNIKKRLAQLLISK